jgi:multiple sugar transport system substrate-binding protein
MSAALKGMTWNHPRGYLPLEAASREWEQRTGVAVSWDKRSLQDFESFPVELLAREYDLIIIDHPHVGQITAEACLTPLDVAGREAEREDLARHSVGQSYASYTWEGRQWAFPVDAATQVQAYRPDRLPTPLARWSEVVELARRGRVAIPLRPPHSLMTFYSLAANLGSPCAVTGRRLIGEAEGATVWELMQELSSLVAESCFGMDPISASEEMSRADSAIDCVPLMYGYVSYAADGFRPARLAFADIPAAGTAGPVGSALGGTGLAVSTFSPHRAEALDFVYWVASGPVQKTLYASAGGQPGHGLAWEDDAVNRPVHDFYRATRRTLEGAYVRPRHDGAMAFQEAASQLLVEGLRARRTAGGVVAGLNALFADSKAPDPT